ncbi:MAG: hypothetical protein HY721_01670, partial [Planctomycetes bacterium]|nr:hypothetical protein [Planctomycetota bacterium]
DKKALKRAEEAMAEARDAMKGGDVGRAAKKAQEAREALEEANLAAQDRLERLRAQRDFKALKDDQDETKAETDSIAERMKESPPFVAPPEGGVPGKGDVESAAGDMQASSGDLGQGQPGKASPKQAKATDKLKAGREKTEEALEELQRALRERILAYLREKFTKMLNEQRLVSRDTRSLDLKLKALRAAAAAQGSQPPEPDRKDRQLSEGLSKREAGLTLLADDVLDLLEEDGTTLVFPGVVEEVRADLLNASGLLSKLDTGDKTQRIQHEVEQALEDILRAIEVAQRSPPPPNPNQGRSSRSGAGPLLPLSSELKMVRALQARVNERTQTFDLARSRPDLTPEEKLQLNAIARKQKEVERMLRKLGAAVGEE